MKLGMTGCGCCSSEPGRSAQLPAAPAVCWMGMRVGSALPPWRALHSKERRETQALSSREGDQREGGEFCHALAASIEATEGMAQNLPVVWFVQAGAAPHRLCSLCTQRG